MLSTQEEKSTLISMFDRETKRERILEALDKEARLKEKNRKGLKEMTTGIIKSTTMGISFDDIREKAHKDTEEERETQALLAEAEQEFYNCLREEMEKRQGEESPDKSWP